MERRSGPHLVKVVEDLVLDNLRVNGCHSVDGRATNDGQVSHVDEAAWESRDMEKGPSEQVSLVLRGNSLTRIPKPSKKALEAAKEH